MTAADAQPDGSRDRGQAARTQPRVRRASGRLQLVWLVAKREYLRTVRRRGYLFGTLLLPLGIAALMAISAFFSVDELEDGHHAAASSSSTSRACPSRTSPRAPSSLDTLTRRGGRHPARRPGRSPDYYVVPADVESSGIVTRVEPEAGPGVEQLATLEIERRARLLPRARRTAPGGGRGPGGGGPHRRGRDRRHRDDRGRGGLRARRRRRHRRAHRLRGPLHGQHLHHQRLPAPVGHRGEGEPRRRDRAELDPLDAAHGRQDPGPRRAPA